MKILLTSGFLFLLFLVIGELQFWLNTYDWSSNDGGWSHTYRYKIANKKLRWILEGTGAIIFIIGVLIAIWTSNF